MKKLTAVAVALMLFGSLSTSAFSWDHFRFHEGHYYHHTGWFGLGAFATGLAVGSYVASLPPQYETIDVNGVPYYYNDGYYYQTGPGGYVVVNPPAGQEQSSSSPAPAGNSPMMYILGTLVAILLIAGIGVLVKKLFTRQPKTV